MREHTICAKCGHDAKGDWINQCPKCGCEWWKRKEKDE